MKLKRPGHKHVHFGKCPTVKDTLEYAKKEGFTIASAYCCRCHHKWKMIFAPDKLPKNLTNGVHSLTMPDQPCIKCDRKRVIVTIKYKKLAYL